MKGRHFCFSESEFSHVLIPHIGMSRLIRGNLRLVLKCEANIIEPFQQAMPDELIHRKTRRKSVVVMHFALLEIDGEMIVVLVLRPARQLRDLVCAQRHREESILRAVVRKDVRKRWRNRYAKTKI